MAAAEKENDPNQVFVGGVPQEADDTVIKEYFAKFGSVEYVKVMKDWNGVSRGFCFLKFSSPEEVENCLLKKDEHHIMNKWVDVKRIGDKSGKPDAENEFKVFVGGIAPETTEATLKSHFATFANVEKVFMSKGYAFVSFSTAEEMESILKLPAQNINGKDVEIKPYTSEKTKNEADSNKLFVGGLPPSVTDTDLVGYFRHYGKVEASVKLDEAGNSKKHGMVQFETKSAATKCLYDWEKHHIQGRWVDVRPYGKADKGGPSFGKDKGKGFGKGYDKGLSFDKGKGKGFDKGKGKGFDKGKGKGPGYAPQPWYPPPAPAHPYSPPSGAGYGASNPGYDAYGPVSGYNPAQYGQAAQYTGAYSAQSAYGGYGQGAQGYGAAAGFQGAYRQGPY
jgi:heterogeneous nuclear ribonucleoprotein A1/A3